MSRHIAMAQPFAFQNSYTFHVLIQRDFKFVSLEKIPSQCEIYQYAEISQFEKNPIYITRTVESLN